MSTWQPTPTKPGVHWVAPLDRREQLNEAFVEHPQFVFQPYAGFHGHVKHLDTNAWHFAATMFDCKQSRPLEGRNVCPVEEAPELPSEFPAADRT